MTSSSEQLPKEYIITEKELGRIKSVIIEDAYHEYDTQFFERIRSRPRPALTPLECGKCKCVDCVPLKNISEAAESNCKEAARKAREDERKKYQLTVEGVIIVLDEMENWMERGYHDRHVYFDEMREHIRTTRQSLYNLRSHPQHNEQESER